MEVLTAETHGWPAVRRATFSRDRGCVAVQSRIYGDDVAPDLCRNQYGQAVRWDDPTQLEWDHVKESQAMGVKAPDDSAHGVMVCAWHHRLSNRWRIDSWVHRQKIRDWLRSHYPGVWDAGT